MIGEERIELKTLLEVLSGFHATNVLKEIEIAVSVDARAHKAVPVHTLQLHIRVILLELEVERLAEVDVGTFDGVHVLSRHLKLVEVEVLWEYFHA